MTIHKLVSLLMVLSMVFPYPLYAGGYPTDDGMERELAKTQHELDKEKKRGEGLESKVRDLENRLSDLENREPAETSSNTSYRSSSWLDELPIHGYFSASYADSSSDSANGTFDQETLHIFLDYNLSETFRFFADFGFTHGAEVFVDGSDVDGVGDITVDEAYLEWKAYDENFKFKFGKFFTPFGTWTPNEYPYTTVSIWNPILVRWAYHSATTTGIALTGAFDFEAFLINHAFYIGNGKGDRPHSLDGNADKVVGSRLGLRIPFGGEENGVEFGINGQVGRESFSNSDFQEKVYGYDVRIDLHPFTVRAETSKSRSNDDVRHIWRDAWFAQAEYHFLEKWTVFYRFDEADDNTWFTDAGDLKVDTVGVAFRPIEPVIFKVSYETYEVGADDDSFDNYHVVGAQVALHF